MTKNEINSMFRDYPDVLTLKKLAQMLDVSTKLASKMINDGEIQAVKVGREYRIAKVNAIAFLLGERKEKKYIFNENSNPNRWTSPTFCDSVVANQKKEVL